MQSSDKAEPLLQPRQPSRRSATLGCCYCIFLVQYAVQFMISPFFPTSPAGEAIGIRLVGAVFAACPNPNPNPNTNTNTNTNTNRTRTPTGTGTRTQTRTRILTRT